MSHRETTGNVHKGQGNSYRVQRDRADASFNRHASQSVHIIFDVFGGVFFERQQTADDDDATSAPIVFSAAFEAEFDAVQAPAPASHAVEDDGFGEFEGAGSGPNVAKEVSFGDFEGADGSAGGPPEWPEVVVGGQKASQ